MSRRTAGNLRGFRTRCTVGLLLSGMKNFKVTNIAQFLVQLSIEFFNQIREILTGIEI